MNPVTLVKPKAPSPKLVELTERLKARIESGEIAGLVVLIAYSGGQYGRADGGDYGVGDMMLAFEDWKFAEMKRLSDG